MKRTLYWGIQLVIYSVFAVLPVAYAYASTSISIGSLSPSTNISVGTDLTFSVGTSGFTNPSYSVSDSLSGSSLQSGNINSSGNFSWTPTSNDVGTHTLTIAVSDSQGDLATTQEQITVSAQASLAIESLSPSSTISPGQTVSFSAVTTGFSSPTYVVSDSFGGSSISNGNINSSGNFSWSPASNQVGTHTITITATDSQGHTASTNETITISSAATVVIQSLSPGSSVNVGQALTFFASASGFSSPSYSVSDSFSGSTLSNSDINASGNFSWTPSSSDTGTHTITVTVIDNSGHTATASQTITVGSASGSASVQSLSPGNTAIVGNQVSFTISAPGFTNPVFTLQDPFTDTTLSTNALNSAGYFTWTPQQQDVGTHNLSIYVNDSYGHTADIPLTLTVDTPNITVTSIEPGTIVPPNTELTFTVSPAGFTNPSYTLADSFSGTTITNSDINTSGYFTWTPTTAQDGSHTITIYATDASGHSANTQITIDVSSGVSLALTAPLPSSTVAPGTTVTLNADAYGFSGAAYSINDSFADSSVTSSDINSAGDFSWTPTISDAGTHTLTITATDIYSHSANAQTTVTVSGTPVQITSTTAATNATFTDYLYLGLTSNEVTELQTVLQQQGFFTQTPTGYYGSVTEAAVEAFQAAHGIEQLGVVGPSTRAALNALGNSSSSSTTSSLSYTFSNFLGVGSSGEDVTQLQDRLTSLGIYSGPVTGYYGSLTEASVETFQGNHDISQVGYVGPSTRAALNGN